MAAITSLTSASRPALLSTVAPRLAAFTQSLRPSWSLPCEPSSSATPVDLAQPASSWSTLIPSISSLMELFPSLVLTTPKKKKSRAARGKGMVNKWLKNRTNINVCPACGQPHLSHTICWSCYSQIKRRWKAEARGDVPRVLQEGYDDFVPGTKLGDGRPQA